jgi:hypothetical protein
VGAVIVTRPLAFSEIQAVHVMDTTVRSFSAAGRNSLEHRIQELRATIERLPVTRPG